MSLRSSTSLATNEEGCALTVSVAFRLIWFSLGRIRFVFLVIVANTWAVALLISTVLVNVYPVRAKNGNKKMSTSSQLLC